MDKACQHCSAPITGTGANTAKLCVKCWADLLTRYHYGEEMTKLAEEYGVTKQTVWTKVRLYA